MAVIGFAMLFACSSVQSQDELPAAAQQLILDGSSDIGHASVVALYDTRGEVICTGTLVAPDLVLTAAHCGAGKTIHHITRGASASHPEQTIAASAWHPHPQFDLATLSHDLAILELVLPVKGVDPSRVVLSGPPDIGDGVVIVGFGRITADLAVSSQRERYMGDATVSDLEPTTLNLEGSPSRPCSGDSGGPVLLADAHGEAIVGVTSHGDLRCTRIAVATRTDAHADFLAPWLMPTASEGCSIRAPSTAVRGSLPSSTLLAFVALSLACLRRRRRNSQPPSERVTEEP
jgi:secreted trypsin-like serine protease